MTGHITSGLKEKLSNRTTFLLATALLLSLRIHPAHAAESSVNTAATPAKTRPSKTPPAETEATRVERIIVTAARGNRMYVSSGGNLGILGKKRGIDVPFSVRNYKSSLIENQQAQTLGEVLDNDPTVRTTTGYGNFAQVFQIRGNVLYGDDVSIDGLYGITPRQLVSPQLYDNVQVLNGANGFLFGAAPGGSGVGGNINLEFKHAREKDLTRVTGDYTSPGRGGGAVDISRRFGDERQFGFRFNAAGMDGYDAINFEKRDDIALGGAFDWHDEKTRINLDMAYQQQDIYGGRAGILTSGLDGVIKAPRAPSPSHNWSQKWAYSNLKYLFGMMNVEHDFDKHITAYGSFGAQSGNEMGDYSTPTLTNARTGDATIGAMSDAYNFMNESVKAGVRANYKTGPIKHEINAGADAIWQDIDSAYTMNWANTYTGNIYDTKAIKNHLEDYSGGSLKNPGRVGFNKLYSFVLSDTMKFWGDRIALTGGFRFQNILANNYDYGTGNKNASYDQHAFSPVIGLVIHPIKNFALYFNRIQGLQKGDLVGANYVNAGYSFAPYQSTQYEVGAKYDIGRFAVGLAFYQLTRRYGVAEAYGTTGQSIYTIANERAKGMELTFNGDILPGLRYNGGISLIDANTRGGPYNGKTAIGVPNYMINGNLEYDVPFLKGLTVIGRVVSTGKQQVTVSNSMHLPAWTRFDLGARYVFLVDKKPMTARFSVENINNQRYWASAYQGYLTMGEPQTFKFSLSMDL
ncbi:TonB-dependent siderophore receptor [Acetobacter estunensis]|uniref:TonB-dependent siderophore receptor n=1 Tax=Acetobacter estunensis TaxID=104097 RepID=A0A967B7D4_9PROT|nr:TonB-dependent receptor [Acetobacter estunensis]NHO53749.1 TonB-dependent siderophore receptor [Acetobacter estunensis]